MIPEQFGRLVVLLMVALAFPALPLTVSYLLYRFKIRPSRPDPIKEATYEKVYAVAKKGLTKEERSAEFKAVKDEFINSLAKEDIDYDKQPYAKDNLEQMKKVLYSMILEFSFARLETDREKDI